MIFYQKVFIQLVKSKVLDLTVTVKYNPEEGLSQQKIKEFRIDLKELGLSDDLTLF